MNAATVHLSYIPPQEPAFSGKKLFHYIYQSHPTSVFKMLNTFHEVQILFLDKNLGIYSEGLDAVTFKTREPESMWAAKSKLCD